MITHKKRFVNMKNGKIKKNFFVGLDIGTDSVGYAVTDEQYNLCKFKGKSYVVTMEVYDCIGNLATSGARGAFVLLKMTNGVQNSAEVSYTATVDPENSRHLILTFNVPAPGLGTDTFRFYELAPCEYYIGSIRIEGKK